MSEEKLYCPEFVFEVCVGLTVHDFLTKEFTLPMVAKKYATALSEHYSDVSEEEISFPFSLSANMVWISICLPIS